MTEYTSSPQIGTMRVYKSGKVRMQMGSVPFRLSQGVPCEVRHDLAAVAAGQPNPRMVLLGDFEKRFVMVPDISALLSEQEQSGQDQGGQERSRPL